MLVSADLFNALAVRVRLKTGSLLCCFGQETRDGLEGRC